MRTLLKFTYGMYYDTRDISIGCYTSALFERWLEDEEDTEFRSILGSFYYYAPYYGEDRMGNEEIFKTIPEGLFKAEYAKFCPKSLRDEQAAALDENPCAGIPYGLNPNDSMRNSLRCTCSSKALFDGFGYDAECPVHKGKL